MDTKIIESPCEVKWLGSPEKSPTLMQSLVTHRHHRVRWLLLQWMPQQPSLKGRPSYFGIQCDPVTPEDQACDLSHTLVVSPDKVIPTKVVEKPNKHNSKAWLQHQKYFDISSARAQFKVSSFPIAESKPSSTMVSELSQIVPCVNDSLKEETAAVVPTTSGEHLSCCMEDNQAVPVRCNKRKQSSPRRMPLLNITNLSRDIPVEYDESFKEATVWIKKELSVSHQDEPHTVLSAADFHGMLKKELVEFDEEDAVTERDLEEECSKVLKESNSIVHSKLDLRKSSWMNGFMMYSRIHRKKFIKRHPGFHTSIISKLMGHAWRSMSSEEQRPYTEKARLCAQELQKMLDAHCQLQND